MNKKKVLSLALILTFVLSVTVFAGYSETDLNGYGNCSLYVDCTSTMRNAEAYTNVNDSVRSSTGVWNYRDNGETDFYTTGIQNGSTSYTHDYDWSEGYDSIHKVFLNNRPSAVETRRLSMEDYEN